MTEVRDFWSRRREKVEREARAEAETARREAERAEAAAFEERPDAEILAHYGLPDPDDMKMGDDFSAFLKFALPDRIRRRALRRLWGSNPVLANVDGLLDYGEDFTDAATVVENLQTTYQVGKGMLKHLEHLAAAEARKAEGETEEAVEDDAAEEELVAEAATEDWPEDIETVAAQPDPTPEDDYAAPAPRRMRIRFDAPTGAPTEEHRTA